MSNKNWNEIKEKALKQFRSGKSFFGKDGAFAPLLEEILQEALEGEMDAHLDEVERESGNKRNGRRKKTIKHAGGTATIYPPEDRKSTFRPKIVEKRERVLEDTFADKIIALYATGVSHRDISKHFADIYNVPISHTLISRVTDRVIPKIEEWRNRSLDPMYPLLMLDAIHFKVKQDNRVITKAVYTVLALNKEGKKEIIGLYINEAEGANFWLSVLADLENRGLKDVLIVCTDNLKGFYGRFKKSL